MGSVISAHYWLDYLIDWALLAFLYFSVLRPKWCRKSRHYRISNTVLYGYLGLLMMATLMPFSFPVFGFSSFKNPSSSFNLVPFLDLRLSRGDSWRQIILNILIMVPFGFLYPLAHRQDLKRTVIAGLVCSLLIEILQLGQVWWGNGSRVFDITDIITNTIGTLAGALLLFGLRRLLGQREIN